METDIIDFIEIKTRLASLQLGRSPNERADLVSLLGLSTEAGAGGGHFLRR